MIGTTERSIFKETEYETPFKSFNKIKAPKDLEVLYPRHLLDESPGEFHPISSFANAVRLGILADRGHVFQFAGRHEIGMLTTGNIDPYQRPPEDNKNDKNKLIIEKSLVKLIIQSNINPEVRSHKNAEFDLQEWYLRALKMWQMFKDIDTLIIRVGSEEIPLSKYGSVDIAWAKAGFPTSKLLLESSDNYSIFELYVPIDPDSPIAQGFKPEVIQHSQ